MPDILQLMAGLRDFLQTSLCRELHAFGFRQVCVILEHTLAGPD